MGRRWSPWSSTMEARATSAPSQGRACALAPPCASPRKLAAAWAATSVPPVAAVRLLTSERELFHLASPPVTVSTVGAVPRGIERLVEAELPGNVRLAVSLHAPTQELREQIVPSARSVPLTRLMEEIDQYGQAASRVSRRAGNERVVLEYCLLAGVNDTEDCARTLGELLRPRKDLVFVNVIPYNPVPGKPYRTPSPEVTWHFVKVLGSYGVKGHARRQLASDVAAACGQLAKMALSDATSERGAGKRLGGRCSGGDIEETERCGKLGARSNGTLEYASALPSWGPSVAGTRLLAAGLVCGGAAALLLSFTTVATVMARRRLRPA